MNDWILWRDEASTDAVSDVVDLLMAGGQA